MGAFPLDRVQEQPFLRSVWGTAPHRAGGISSQVEHGSFDYLLLSLCCQGVQSGEGKAAARR